MPAGRRQIASVEGTREGEVTSQPPRQVIDQDAAGQKTAA